MIVGKPHKVVFLGDSKGYDGIVNYYFKVITSKSVENVLFSKLIKMKYYNVSISDVQVEHQINFDYILPIGLINHLEYKKDTIDKLIYDTINETSMMKYDLKTILKMDCGKFYGSSLEPTSFIISGEYLPLLSFSQSKKLISVEDFESIYVLDLLTKEIKDNKRIV